MFKDTMTDTATDLRELMELAGLTFKAWCDRIGVKQAQVFCALSGEIKLRPESMKEMEIAIVQPARDRADKIGRGFWGRRDNPSSSQRSPEARFRS